MIFVTLIPTSRNDGTPVDDAEFQEILNDLWRRFGGCTVEGPVRGHWIDPADGQHYADECWRVTVECDPQRLDEAESAIVSIGKRLGQKAMYFEVRYFDGIRFLQILEE